MTTMHEEIIGGLNHLVTQQRGVEAATELRVYEFDNETTVVHTGHLDQAPTFTTDNFRPRGMTALLDAIHFVLDDLVETADAPIVCIVTDGHENCSRSTFSDTKHRLDSLQAKGWQFRFLGANQDAVFSGANLGIQPANCMTFEGDQAEHAMRSLSANITRTRTNEGDGAFTSAERMSSVGRAQ
jgi:hypothetical protein